MSLCLQGPHCQTKCTYKGRIHDKMKVSKITHWLSYTTKTEVCDFLGTVGTSCTWIKDFTLISHPLTNLTHANIPFEWTSEAFIIEVDAKYIKGMTSNPDIQLNARLAGISLFDFKLHHVLVTKHL